MSTKNMGNRPAIREGSPEAIPAISDGMERICEKESTNPGIKQ